MSTGRQSLSAKVNTSPVVPKLSTSIDNDITFYNDSLFANPETLFYRPASTIVSNPVLVVAPHPDDETLGCGGAIALLRAMGCTVRVLVMSDGTASHPNSRQYPAPVLQTLREQETQNGLSILGVEPEATTFLGFKDGFLPTLESPGIRSAIARCRDYLTALAPQTIFVPWRHDPHSDHRAAWNLIHTALCYLPLSPRVIEYPVWDWDPEQHNNLQLPETIAAWRLDISSVLALKRQAIAAYRSQTTNLIKDDPDGFRLSGEMLANFTRPWEVYLEECK